MSTTRRLIIAVVSSLGGTLVLPSAAFTQEPPVAPTVTRTDLLSGVLPAGNYRNLRVAVIELAPGATAPHHRHDVAVVAYVLEGTVENQFDGGAVSVQKTGEAWWERPGTVHDVARNASSTARARLLLVYVGEEGKAATVPLR